MRVDGCASLIPQNDGKTGQLPELFRKSLRLFGAEPARTIHIDRMSQHQFLYVMFLRQLLDPLRNQIRAEAVNDRGLPAYCERGI